jgi:preprotein translocase subunit SecF
MSEHNKHPLEHESNHEQYVDIAAEVEKNFQRLEKEHVSREEQAEELQTEKIQETIEKESQTSEQIDTNTHNQHEDQPDTDVYSHHIELKKDTYKKTLRNTQAQLPQAQRAFSTFIHHPTIETVSEIASKTIARPTGIAYGAIAATIGIALALFFAYRYGFTYNYLLFLVLFSGGYVLSTIIELSLTKLKKLTQKTS